MGDSLHSLRTFGKTLETALRRAALTGQAA